MLVSLFHFVFRSLTAYHSLGSLPSRHVPIHQHEVNSMRCCVVRISDLGVGSPCVSRLPASQRTSSGEIGSSGHE